jgi:NADPH:quinone reductase-like Zn-dependent oxidoreductase
VVATASPANFEYLGSLGADATVDYNQSDAAEKIKEITGDSLAFGLDTFASKQTQQIAVKAFGSKGGKLVVILPPQASARLSRKDVEIQGMPRHYSLLSFTLLIRHSSLHCARPAFRSPQRHGESGSA